MGKQFGASTDRKMQRAMGEGAKAAGIRLQAKGKEGGGGNGGGGGDGEGWGMGCEGATAAIMEKEFDVSLV